MANYLKLSEAMNTYTPALLIIEKKGYQIRIIPSDDEYEIGDWVAYRDKCEFCASNPLSLLALVQIGEERGVNWRKKKHEMDLYNSLIDQYIT